MRQPDRQPRREGPKGCWAELTDLVEQLETDAAAAEGRSSRSVPEVWAEIEALGKGLWPKAEEPDPEA